MEKIKVSFEIWIQLLGMLGVLGGLIFVGLEMQQSQRIAIAGQIQARNDVLMSFLQTPLEGNVTLSKIVDATAGYTILAKADTGSGDFAELAAGTNSVLRRDGSGDLAFGTIDSYHITNGAIMNTDINASAGIDASKLAANDIGDAQLDLDDCSFYAASGVAKAGNRVYIEEGNATGGSNGDIWLKYTA